MTKRQLTIKCPIVFHEDSVCVYRVWFGDAFYIGSTKNLQARMRWLINTILRCFEGRRVGNNSQTLIMNYLTDNPEIIEATVEILEFVDSEYNLVNAERAWLNKHFLYVNCLNYSNKTTRRIDGVLVRPTI